MTVNELTPREVADRLEADEKSVYLDVRSEHEFEEGYIYPGAINKKRREVNRCAGQRDSDKCLHPRLGLVPWSHQRLQKFSQSLFGRWTDNGGCKQDGVPTIL